MITACLFTSLFQLYRPTGHNLYYTNYSCSLTFTVTTIHTLVVLHKYSCLIVTDKREHVTNMA